ncbi:MAG: DUF3616 domain-containing protein [Sedimentisphaerales bacterium]|nr:DUF3616 domain-containing protein [Sedimentisphaerales bacterium]
MEKTFEMKVITKVVFFVLICGVTGFSYDDSAIETLIYYGTSDASAAAAVAEDMFVVADDENNLLRVYKTGQPSLPVFSYDLTPFLGIEPPYPEADIEGATVLDDTVYLITSHGRNTDGKIRPNRYRFFAVKVNVQNQNITINPVGTPCRTLIHSLLKAENMRHLGLDQATRFDSKKLTKQQLKNLAPKENGLNIEALCASADGNTFYIGFRNPRLNSKAIVVPLNNPRQVIEKQQPPIFADPLLWDLKGFGIRSMEYSRFHKAYFIIAGPHNDEPAEFALYRWSGRKDESPLLVRLINSDFNPEALVAFKSSDKLLLLSDDGGLAVDVSDASECMRGKLRKDGKCLNKYLTNADKKHFRGIWLQP